MDSYLQEMPLKQYPQIYRKIKDIQDISGAELELYKSIDKELDKINQNADFRTADEKTIERYEKMLGIQYTGTESMDFRRARIENRFNLNKKYVMIFYCEKLNELIGHGNWSATINALRTEMTIEGNAKSASWYKELIETLNMIKPVRLQITVRAALNETIIIRHKSSRKNVKYHFFVGISRIGTDSIGEEYGTEESIGGNLMISQTELNKLAETIKRDVTSVLVNDTYKITNFTLKTVEKSKLTLEYVIPLGIDFITNIKLMAGSEVMANADVKITSADNVLMKHTFEIATQESVIPKEKKVTVTNVSSDIEGFVFQGIFDNRRMNFAWSAEMPGNVSTYKADINGTPIAMYEKNEFGFYLMLEEVKKLSVGSYTLHINITGKHDKKEHTATAQVDIEAGE